MKIHILGIAGSGKTTLAQWIRGIFNIPTFDLDQVVYDLKGGERPPSAIVSRRDEIHAHDGRVTEGAYRNAWLLPLLDDATAIVWLDPSFATTAIRMLKRHVRAELSRNNQHPGWAKLIRFLRYNWRTASEQRAETVALLSAYSNKVFRCRTSRELGAFKAHIQRMW